MKKNLLQTAGIVTTFSVLERSLGFFYRIVLARLIGAEGMGLYQVSLSVFSVFLTLGTGGIPVSVSRLISKSKATLHSQDEDGATSAGLFLSFLFTFPVTVAFLFFKRPLSVFFTDRRCVPLFCILLTGLTATSFYAVIRGSFWGNKEFFSTSLWELIEEAVMVIVGILIIRSGDGAYEGARKACVAVVLSYAVSFLLSVLAYFSKGRKLVSFRRQLKPLASSSLPITGVRALSSLVSSAVSVLLPVMMVKTGMKESEALALFGIVSGMVMPILYTPSTLIGAVSLVLSPELSEDYYKHHEKRLNANIERGVFISCFIACFLIPFFFVLGVDMGNVLYSNALAGEMIEKCCFILFPMSLSMVTTGVLNSMNREKTSFLFFLIGAGAMLLSVLFLPKYIGIYAYPVGSFASFLFTALLNGTYLMKLKKIDFRLVKKCLLLLITVLPVSLFGKLVYSLFSGVFGVFGVAICSTLCMCLFCGLLYSLLKLFPKRFEGKFFARNQKNSPLFP